LPKRSPAASVVRSTVDSLKRNPAVLCSKQFAALPKLFVMPSNVVTSCAPGVNRSGDNRKITSHGQKPVWQWAQW